jgi:hypothetical protein
LAAAKSRARQVRRRRTAALSLWLAAVLIGFDLVRGGDALSASGAPGAVSASSPTPAPAPAPPPVVSAAPPEPEPMVVRQGDGTFAFASGSGPVTGRAGPVVHYRVAVENKAGLDLDKFAGAVERTLGDPRSWTAEGVRRLQRVAETEAAQFTVLLATPVTSEAICQEDGLQTHQYTSCRLQDGRVVLNSERWITGVPDYGAPLSTYQEYLVNHEVGHQFGFGHELCPAPGQVAPVMQQQTLGLDGCTANAWPYIDGQRYAGPAAND